MELGVGKDLRWLLNGFRVYGCEMTTSGVWLGLEEHVNVQCDTLPIIVLVV
jgi:hypothetical protein